MDTFFCLFSFSSPFSHYEKMMSKPPTDAIWTAHTTPLNKKRNTENKVELTSLLFTHQNHIENITNGAEKTGDIHFFSFYYIQWVFFLAQSTVWSGQISNVSNKPWHAENFFLWFWMAQRDDTIATGFSPRWKTETEYEYRTRWTE